MLPLLALGAAAGGGSLLGSIGTAAATSAMIGGTVGLINRGPRGLIEGGVTGGTLGAFTGGGGYLGGPLGAGLGAAIPATAFGGPKQGLTSGLLTGMLAGTPGGKFTAPGSAGLMSGMAQMPTPIQSRVAKHLPNDARMPINYGSYYG